MNVMFVSPRLTNTGYAVVNVDKMEPITWAGIHKGPHTGKTDQQYALYVADKLLQAVRAENVDRIVVDSNAIYHARADNYKRMDNVLGVLISYLTPLMTTPYRTVKSQQELKHHVKRNFKVLYDKRVGAQTIRAFAMALDIDRSEYDPRWEE